MTPYERVQSRLKGLSWEEAEDIGVEILARCLAMHVYAIKDGDKYFPKVMERIALRGDEWAHEPGNDFILAMVTVAHKREQEKKEDETDSSKLN